MQSIQCIECSHYRFRSVIPTCAAFPHPKRIPQEIYNGTIIHDKPIEGQGNDIAYKNWQDTFDKQRKREEKRRKTYRRLVITISLFLSFFTIGVGIFAETQSQLSQGGTGDMILFGGLVFIVGLACISGVVTYLMRIDVFNTGMDTWFDFPYFENPVLRFFERLVSILLILGPLLVLLFALFFGFFKLLSQ